MKTHAKRALSLLLSLAMLVSLLAGMTLVSAAGSTVNSGTRHQLCTSLSAQASAYYTGSNSWASLSALSGTKTTSSVEAIGSPLFNALQKLMKGTLTNTVTYKSLKTYWKETDRQSGGSDAVLFYSDVQGSGYNREHVWPKSHGNFHESGAGSDLHHLRPTDSTINSTRNHWTFGDVKASGISYSTKDYNGKTVLWYNSSYRGNDCLGLVEVNDNIKGDVARVLLYVYTTYGSSTENTNLFTKASRSGSGDNANTGDKVIDSLDTLLEWMEMDPVDTWEMSRNDCVENVQGNRNVFIDYPEFAWMLFGQDVPSDYQTPSNPNPVSYQLSAVSNNTAWGTVSLSGKTITASPKTGYEAVGAAVSPEGAATVTQNGNTFTVSNQTADCTVTILFAEKAKVAVTVSYVVPAGVSCASTSGYAGDTITLATPSGAPTAAPDAEFIGWSKTAVSETTEKPTALYSSLVVNSNMTFYAVYSYVNNATTYYSSDPVIHTDCDHSGGKTTTDRKEATCTEAGYEKIYCADCGALLSETTLNALGHNYVDGVCTRCGEKDPNYDPEPFVCDGGKDCPSYKFSDVNAGNWYHEAVDFAVTKNLFNGMTETTFAPDTAMTRAMLVTVLYRSENTPDISGESNPFTDVPDGQWYTDAVIWAAKEGIVNGMSETTFAPNESITREQIATILHRYAGSPKASGNLYRFSDAFSVSTYAYDAMVWAVQEGIIGGMGGALAPKDNATRAQIAMILYRYLNK